MREEDREGKREREKESLTTGKLSKRANSATQETPWEGHWKRSRGFSRRAGRCFVDALVVVDSQRCVLCALNVVVARLVN